MCPECGNDDLRMHFAQEDNGNYAIWYCPRCMIGIGVGAKSKGAVVDMRVFESLLDLQAEKVSNDLP